MNEQRDSKNQDVEKNEEFKNRCYGVIIIKSKHSNFNADFSGFPRRLPDKEGTIYATDKALKYAIRRYWLDRGEKVFVWKTYDEEGYPKTLEDRYKSKEKEKGGNILRDLLGFIDIRCFGITYAVKQENYSICGSVQISYGINRFGENVVYSSQILSPYRTAEEKEQSTIGSETKAMESHYVFDFVINPKNLYDHYEELIKENKDFPKLMCNDIELLKEALCKGVTNLNSAAKIGSENELLLFVTLNEKSLLQIPTMKDLITITKDGNKKYKINLIEIFNHLKKYSSEIEKIEIYYDEEFTEVYKESDEEFKKLLVEGSLNYKPKI